MNTELLHKLLSDARDAAPNPSAAMAVEDLMRDLRDLEDLKAHEDFDGFGRLYLAMEEFKELRDHVNAQPFDTSEEDDDDGTVTITPLTPGAFHDWLGELERLAQ